MTTRSVTNLSKRIAAREQAKFKARFEAHDCVLNRRAISDGVAITFSNVAEQHRLHVAFGEEWCDGCEACVKLKAQGRPATKFSVPEIVGLREHWGKLVACARLFEKEHVVAGLELLVRFGFECTRDMDADGNLVILSQQKLGNIVESRLNELGWRRKDDTTWCVGMEAVI